MTQMEQTQHVADVTLAAAAVSAPLWLEAVTNGLHLYVLAGGAVLLTLRVIKAVRDCRRKK